MATATRIQILVEIVCISYTINTPGKIINPSILRPSMGKQQSRLKSNFAMSNSLEEWKLWIHTC